MNNVLMNFILRYKHGFYTLLDENCELSIKLN